MSILPDHCDAAQRYADLGWRMVLLHGLRDDGGCTCRKDGDCPSAGKHPRLKDYAGHATADADALMQQLERYPQSNLGVLLGRFSSIVDVEFDSDEGKATIAELLPEGAFTPTYRSHRSTHRLFRCPDDLPPVGVVTIRGVEFRMGTDGKPCQSVLPPSRHCSGAVYEWLPGLSPDDVDVQPLPEPLRQLLLSDRGGSLLFTMDDGETLETHLGAAEGDRNKTLCRLVGKYVRQHGVDAGLMPAAYAWADRCQPPMPPGEVGTVISHIASREIEKRHAAAGDPGTQPAKASLQLVPLSAIDPQPVEWVWPNRIAKGKLTVLGGDGGCGKTTVVCDLAARLSRGEALPDGDAPAETVESLIVSAEDGAGDTIRARVEASGGDLDRVFVIDGEVVDFRSSVATLRDQILQRPSLKLLVFDTLPDFIGTADDYKNSEVRQALRPILDLAIDAHVAVVGICHFGKGGGSKSANRLLGSVAYVNVSRSVLYVVHDKDHPGRRLLWHEKSNLGPMASTLAFTLEQQEHNPQAPALVAWEPGPVFIDDILPHLDGGGKRGKTKQQKAGDWLLRFLAPGPRPASEVLDQGKAAGFSRAVLYRAADAVGIDKTGTEWVLGEATAAPPGTFTF